jgi:S-adenosylmethionine:tRNA ribosyltransferase-isomerase
MRIEEFDYSLPRHLIAQQPVQDRTSSRLLVLNRSDGVREHRYFRDITEYLREKDLIVVNDTKVIPARLIGKKKTGGIVEILLTEKLDERRYYCLVNGVKRGIGKAEVHVGETMVQLEAGLPFWTIEFPEDRDAATLMADSGRMPLPHYIKRDKDREEPEDYDHYQTVYARHEGSIAAPTAGLHFSEALLNDIQEMGVKVARVTLHIGVGTFFLIKSEEVEGHEMHREYYSMPPDSLKAVRETKAAGGRVIAVGTSAVRTLETACACNNGASLSGYSGLFIYPGYRFRVVDALITNFHLPRSTPLMLVCAFAGKDAIQTAYKDAIERSYRFYSYGDAMLIS